MTKSEQIRGYKEANPTHKAKDIAKACGVTTTYVYQVLHNAKKKKPVAKEEKPTDGQKIVRSEINRLNDRLSDVLFTNETQAELLDMYSERIEQLEMDVVGYRAVISYLQGQLDGLAV